MDGGGGGRWGGTGKVDDLLHKQRRVNVVFDRSLGSPLGDISTLTKNAIISQ